jgi:hypothetical protein
MGLLPPSCGQIMNAIVLVWDDDWADHRQEWIATDVVVDGKDDVYAYYSICINDPQVLGDDMKDFRMVIPYRHLLVGGHETYTIIEVS